MKTVTISREMGSLGTPIAQATADRLGFRLMHREVINEAAMRAGAPEVALSQIDDLDLLDLRPTSEAFQAYHQAVESLLKRLADEGQVVILGRAGQVILNDDPTVLHVKVIAPMALRVERIANRQGISEKAACARIRQSDCVRRRYLRRHYHVNWRDPELYDLVINTIRVDIDVAATLIERFVTGCAELKCQQSTPR